MFQTTHYDQLVKVFDDWSYAGFISIAAYETQIKVSMGEDIPLRLKRSDMHYFYQIRRQLSDCLTELKTEIENNLLTASRDQHDIIYLSKLAKIHNQIVAYLNEEYKRQLGRFEGITFDIEPPKKVTIQKVTDSKGRVFNCLDEPLDPYLNEYTLEEQLVIEDAEAPPVVIRLINTVAEGFRIGANIIYQAITQSIVYKSHHELIQLTTSQTGSQSNLSSKLKPVFDKKLIWKEGKGHKTDLAELVWALAKSGRIIDNSTGQDATLETITERFEQLFGIEKLDIHGLMKGRYGTASKPTSYKAQNGKTFVNELQRLLEDRVLD